MVRVTTLLAALCLGAIRGAAALAAEPPTTLDSLGLFETRNQWAEAESVARVLDERVARSVPFDSLAHAHNLIAIGRARSYRRMFGDPETFATLEGGIALRARHAPPGDRSLARGYLVGATIFPEAGRPQDALRYAETGMRVALAATPPDTLILASFELARANALVALGRPAEARPVYEHSIVLSEMKFGPTSRPMVGKLAEYGAFLSRLGEFDEGRVALKRAIAIAERDTIVRGDLLEGSLSRLSTLEVRAGNLAESIALARRAYEIALGRDGPDAVPTARLRTVLAYRLDELGDRAGAAAHLREIVPVFEAKLGEKNPQTVNARLVYAADLVALGDTAAARAELDRAVAAMSGQARLANSNAADVAGIEADLANRAGDVARARATLEHAIARQWEFGDPLGTTIANLHGHWMATVRGPGDQSALVALDGELARLRDSTSVRATPEWTLLLADRANAESRAGLRDSAWAHALEAERRGRERLRYELEGLSDRQALQLASGLGAPSETVVRLAATGDDAERREAWDRVVRWRGLVGQEVARRRPPVGADADTALAGARARWLAAQRRLAQLAVSGLANPENPATAARFAAAREDADEAERAYVRRAGAALPPDSLALAHVLDRLSAGAALVAIVASGEGEARELGAFVATAASDSVRYVALGRADALERALFAWTDALARPPVSNADARRAESHCRSLGTKVRTAFWDPIARATAGARTIELVPEGAVFALPWLALPSTDGRYLADEAIELRVRNAERDLLRPEVVAGGGLLALGGPDYARAGEPQLVASAERPVVRARTLSCSGEKIDLPALPSARAEAEDLARRWSTGDAALLVDAAATEAAFKRDAPGRTVLHLATHGVAIADTCGAASPGTRGIGGVAPATASASTRKPKLALESSAAPRRALPGDVWLALAGANRPEAPDENEGLLTAEEVVTLDLSGADWVVLSACHSGVGRTWAREGVFGMRRAFHLAGARSVIASGWAVADEPTRAWMLALYEARGGSGSTGAAIREACRSVLAARRKAGQSTHPFYWAAFSGTE